MVVNKSLIVINLEAENKNEAISKLVDLIEKEDKITSKKEFINCVLEREKEFSTGIGNGIAIPHGKSGAVKEAIIAFAKLRNGIDWNSIDNERVNLIFLLGVPEKNTANLHLKILAQLSRKLMDEDFVKVLQDAYTVDEIFNVLCDIEAI